MSGFMPAAEGLVEVVLDRGAAIDDDILKRGIVRVWGYEFKVTREARRAFEEAVGEVERLRTELVAEAAHERVALAQRIRASR